MSATTATARRAFSARGPILDVRSAGDPPPITYTARWAEAAEPTVLSICGGCDGMDYSAVLDMFGILERMLTRDNGVPFGGVLFAGGTIEWDKASGAIKTMVTQLASHLVKRPGFAGRALAMGHSPRTKQLVLLRDEGGRFALNDRGTGLDPDYDGHLLEQENSNTLVGWDFDVAKYLGYLVAARDIAQMTLCGLIINGGPVTLKEFFDSLLLGIPNVVLPDSGRAAKDIEAAVLRNDWGPMDGALRAKGKDADALVSDYRARLEQRIDRSQIHFGYLTNPLTIHEGFVKFGML